MALMTYEVTLDLQKGSETSNGYRFITVSENHPL